MEEDSVVKSRLLLYIEYIKSNPSDFSGKIGMSRAYIRNLKDEISTKAMRNIIRSFPDLNIYWLIDGIGDMILYKDSNNVNNDSLVFHLKEENRALKEDNNKLIRDNARLQAKLEMFGSIFQDDKLLKSAVIGSTGGKTGIGKNSIIIESGRLLVCCSDTIFCLSIPDLTLLWCKQADQITCFEIFKYLDSYIIHGEVEISRLDKNGNILWQQSSADIFTTLEGKDNFFVAENYIIATDWKNRKYKFDFNGTILQTTEQKKKRLWKRWK